jgi:hypothetical protein
VDNDFVVFPSQTLFLEVFPQILFEDGRVVLSRGHVFIVSAAIFAQVTGVGTMNEARNSHQMQ